ncbi:hypothetical protein H311_04004 [Anncaliia algerae PRA109]|uniref:Small GTP-binding protein domain n=1 Tax=Anncaliia algerae PRA339 TaxID=1288291 RepID=A0A059F213_9MICR|nr:hypothetical protein H311_04004 [Anncaliia algerae PRA109]KCZ81127.1 hypothetical protein H312_01419 [Anncaliia algerae PRA339]
MGGVVINRLKKLFHTSKPQQILMVGLDSVGKTTILYLLQNNNAIETVPTIGFNIEDIKIGNTTLKICDMGGQKKIRGLWKSYSDDSNGIVYVFDIADPEKWEEGKGYLIDIAKEKDVPVLIILNKIDLIGYNQSEIDNRVNIINEMCRESIPNTKFRIFPISAKVDNKEPYKAYFELENAFTWLNSAIEGKI